jgi:uncharacterized DUF497 family protein
MGFTRFEWDPAKDLENLAKHGVSFTEAQRAFADERCVIGENLKHSENEARYFCFGRIDRGVLTVRFTWRAGVIRIIGAGFCRKGKASYERENSLYR